MSTVTESLKNTKQEKIAWFIKQLPIVFIMMLASAGDSIVQSVSVHWLPLMGFVLGVSLASIGFWLFKKISVTEATRQEKITVISGFSLLMTGAVIMVLNNSVATIFNVQWLHASWGTIVFSFGLICIGYWTLTLFSELFKGDRIWKYIGIFIHTGLFAGSLFKFGLGW